MGRSYLPAPFFNIQARDPPADGHDEDPAAHPQLLHPELKIELMTRIAFPSREKITLLRFSLLLI